MRDVLLNYTIYAHPRDYPEGYSMTTWAITPAGPERLDTQYVADLKSARALVPPGLYCLLRDPSDDPVIVETWL